MKSFTTKTMAIVTAAAAALTLSACSNDDKDSSGSKETTSAARTTAAAATLPTAADLNTVLTTATDPAAPVEAKIRTVQGGQSAPELFETMTRSKQESGANFQVVDPILPGYTPNSVLATVSFSVPGNENRKADNVEFIFEDNVWKLSQTWACTLINNTVAPEQVPPMCANDTAVPQPSGAAPAPAPAPGAAPAPAAPAPAPGAAPAPAAPAPASGAAPAPAAPAPAAR